MTPRAAQPPTAFVPPALEPADLDRPSWRRALTEHLRSRGLAVLREMPLSRIVEILDEAARMWLEDRAPDQEAVVEAMARSTGLSRPMVRESLRVEQLSSTGDEIRRAMAAELGDPAMLDRFVLDEATGLRRRAFGPALVLALAPGNVPALSHLPIMRSLLVKAPCLVKAASAEPTYAAAYCRSLALLHPPLADGLAALHWKGGDEAVEGDLFAAAEHVIFYGATSAARAVAARLPPGRRFHEHGHRLGLVLLGPVPAERREALAEALARDVAMFDQHACLSPRWIFAEGPDAEALLPLGEALVRALRKLQIDLPRGPSLDGGRALSRWLDEVEADGLVGLPRRALSRRDDPFSVVLDGGDDLDPGPGGRAITLRPYPCPEALGPVLARLGPVLQNAAIRHEDPAREAELAELVARAGASRICAPGRMATPTMSWRHDGRPCMLDLLRFVDRED